MNQIDLNGRVAVITGGAQGIGYAAAERMLKSGASVVLWDIDADRLAQAETALSTLGKVKGQVVELTVEADIEAATKDAMALHGRIDILVNNAGATEIVAHDDLAGATPEIWRRLYDINVIAPFVLVTAAEQALRAADGCVVNITSLAGVKQLGSSIPYAASKAACNHQTRLLAKALGPGIRVNAVAPGLVDTPWTVGAYWDELRAVVVALSPLRRSATPDDVAEAVLFLVRSSYVTGQVVEVDGGLGLLP